MTYPSFGTEWRKRWVQLPSSEVLHRVAVTISPSPEQRAETEAEYARLFASIGAKTEPPELTDEWEMDGLIPIGIQGTTACGRSGRLAMPGMISRMAARRCKQCCRKAGVRPGKGAPYNDEHLPDMERHA